MMSVNATTDDVVHPGMGRGDDDRYKLPATVNLPGYSGYPQDRSARENMPVPHDEISESAAFASGKMSSVRRTFCLFVTFDLGLTFILWVIYTQLIGDVGWRAFERQVEAFTIKTSLFDTVMMATVRFVFLILAYALFRIRHWWTVALTTLLSSAFLLAKIFLFDLGVLVRQRPENKLCPHYSPTPMKVTSRKGSMVTADGGGRKVTRNSSFFKKVPLQMPPHAEPPEVSPDAEPEDVEPTVPQFDTCPPESPEPPPDLPRRSSRVRRLPQYLQDYE